MKDHIKMQKLIHKAKEWRKRRRERQTSKLTSKREQSSRPQTKDSRFTTNTEAPTVNEEENTIEISSNYHTQEQSALFSTLPGEIRVLIWAYALAPVVVDDSSQAATMISENSATKEHSTSAEDPESTQEPEIRILPRAHTSLLLACRRIYSEAHHLGLEQYEYPLSLSYPTPDDHATFESKAELVIKSLVSLDHFLRILTVDNRRALKGLRISTNLFWLRDAKYVNTFAIARGKWPARLAVEIFCRPTATNFGGSLNGVGAKVLEQARGAGVGEIMLEFLWMGEDLEGTLDQVVKSLGLEDGEWRFWGKEVGRRKVDGNRENEVVKCLRWRSV